MALGRNGALLATEQVKKIDFHVSIRRNYARFLLANLQKLNLPGLTISIPDELDAHDFYILPMVLNEEKLGCSRDDIAAALTAEGVVGVVSKYGRLNELPAFRHYPTQPLPVADQLSRSGFLGLYMCGHSFSKKSLIDISRAFEKIWDLRHKLNRK